MKPEGKEFTITVGGVPLIETKDLTTQQLYDLAEGLHPDDDCPESSRPDYHLNPLILKICRLVCSRGDSKILYYDPNDDENP
tara:strand:- start:951 stop:1196 length:246 start_codon:yes stop_codon:yes gene_type:complete